MNQLSIPLAWLERIKLLTSEQRGRLFTAMLLYAVEASEAEVYAAAAGPEQLLLPTFVDEFEKEHEIDAHI